MMAIVRREAPSLRRAREWNPFETMSDLLGWDPFQEMAPSLPGMWRGEEPAYVPPFDVRETKDAYLFKADLPGIKEQDLEISVTGSRLTVSGKREAENVEESDRCYCSERSYGSFTRSFTLPEGINADQIQAEFKDGVLSIHVPKSPETQPKRISVSEAGEKKVKS